MFWMMLAEMFWERIVIGFCVNPGRGRELIQHGGDLT